VAALTLYLADTSAWHRADHPEVAAGWEQRLATNSLASCAQVRLDLYSARSARDYDQLSAEPRPIPSLPPVTRTLASSSFMSTLLSG